MSGGLNKAFTRDMAHSPCRYLANNHFSSAQHNLCRPPNGLRRVNLSRSDNGIAVRTASEQRSFGSHAFLAYVCIARHKQVHSVRLADEANFFFTPTLNGCGLRIQPVGREVIIEHYHGVQSSRASWKDAYAGLPRGGGSGDRMWSSGNSWNSFVVGVRDRASGRWGFYAQTYDFHGEGLTVNLV